MATTDPQRSRLYIWESANGWDANTIGPNKAKSLIISACKLYKVQPPEIMFHTTRQLPWSCPEENVISLQRDKYLNIPIALHEVTHHIVWHQYGARPQDHGPTFLGIYLDLLDRNGFPSYTSAKGNGLRWKRLDTTK